MLSDERAKVMAIKRAEMGEFFAELCRFIMFTGLFFWLLTNGPEFANDVIMSLWKIGGEASGTGNSIYPGTLIDLAMQVFQNTIKHVNFLQPDSIVVPIIIALIILIVCALTAVNMILLLCAAWVVVYAGLISWVLAGAAGRATWRLTTTALSSGSASA
jgi:type IV secretion system protein VirB6/type IV secretion system protein TrbL